MIKVTAVRAGSIGEELGLAPGTELVAVNGHELEDFLDWEFLTAEDRWPHPIGQTWPRKARRCCSAGIACNIQGGRCSHWVGPSPSAIRCQL